MTRTTRHGPLFNQRPWRGVKRESLIPQALENEPVSVFDFDQAEALGGCGRAGQPALVQPEDLFDLEGLHASASDLKERADNRPHHIS